MRTQDVKCTGTYLHNNEEVTVVKRIHGKETTKPNMQSSQMFTGYKRTQKKFLLSNGKEVFAKELKPIS